MNRRTNATLKSLITGILITVVVGPSIAATRVIGHAIAEYDVADPTAPVISPENILESDRFWPFRVTLNVEWTPSGDMESIPARPGVLVRVNFDGTARIDFASFGQHDIPIDRTDLIEAANLIRIGKDSKMAPNLILTIGNKLIDTTGDRVNIFHIPRNTRVKAILCVYVDPADGNFSEIANVLARLSARTDLQTVVFPDPSTTLRDLGVWKRFRKFDLRVPFIRERYREPFTRSLLGTQESQNLPYLQLVTRDGRMLIEGRFGPNLEHRLDEALSGTLTGVAPR